MPSKLTRNAATNLWSRLHIRAIGSVEAFPDRSDADACQTRFTIEHQGHRVIRGEQGRGVRNIHPTIPGKAQRRIWLAKLVCGCERIFCEPVVSIPARIVCISVERIIRDEAVCEKGLRLDHTRKSRTDSENSK